VQVLASDEHFCRTGNRFVAEAEATIEMRKCSVKAKAIAKTAPNNLTAIQRS
jgi:hypothetical protein